jgi:TolB-like protein/Tfp pilus assembly protein PilF
MKSLLGELKRRNVFKVGVAYAVVAWVILQFVDIVNAPLHLPDWFQAATIVALAIGFPIALVLSWAYEMTPQGIMKTKDADRRRAAAPKGGGSINKLIIGGLALAVVFLLADRFWLESERTPPVISEAQASQASIAVLPFVNMSGDPAQEYFSDGISEEILNVLAQVKGLSVASRTSAFAFKGQERSIKDIAAALNVNLILEGSVRRSENTLRITAQLIDTQSDRHLWSETFDRNLTDIFAVQDEISTAIVGALRNTLGLQDLTPAPVAVATDNMNAYDLFLKGRELFLTRQNLPESVRLLEQAVAADPSFAGAWETLAAAYSIMPSWGYGDRSYRSLANEAADKAIALDPGLSLAYAVKGTNAGAEALVDGGSPEWKKSFEDLDRAIANNPNNATAYLWRAFNWHFLGFLEKAEKDFDACLRIDPAYQNCKRHKATLLYNLGRPREAIALYQQGIEEGFYVRAASETSVFAMVRAGQDLPALIFWGTYEEDGVQDFPAKAWVHAAKHPGTPDPEAWKAVEAWGARHGLDVGDRMPHAAFLFGQFDRIGLSPDYSFFHWWPEAHGFRQTAYFKKLAAASKLPDYWFEAGFPPQCRAKGKTDFECD